MSEEEYIRNRLDMINRNSVYGLMIDRLNCPKPSIYIGQIKVKSLKERLEDNKMKKATSVQKIKNVKDICFDISHNPIERESKLTIVASTNDDIFAFEFEGQDICQSCKAAGLFTGWEKDQKIRELKQQLQQAEHDKRKYEEKIKNLEHADMLDKDAADYWSKEYDTLSERFVKLKEENKKLKDKVERTIREKHELKKELSLEKAANEVQFNYAIDEVKEVSYVVVDKEEYNVLINGKIYNLVQLMDRIQELEALKTPTIENFADEKPSTRADILDQAKKCVCGQREQDYGTPESNFQLIADLWNGYLGEKTDNPVISVTPVDVTMMMALLKIARIRNGGGSGDSFVDLAGYAACGGEIWGLQKETN